MMAQAAVHSVDGEIVQPRGGSRWVRVPCVPVHIVGSCSPARMRTTPPACFQVPRALQTRVAGRRGLLSGFEAPAVVAGFDDVAVVRETIEEGGGHLGITEDARPFAEGEVGGDEDRGALIELADEVEEELAAGLREGQIAEFIEDNEVDARQLPRQPALAAAAGLALEAIDQIHHVVEPAAGASADTAAGNGDRQMRLPGTGGTRDILPHCHRR